MPRLLVATIVALAVGATTAAASPPHARLALHPTSLGSVLADARGHTLYVFDEDKAGRSACFGACAAAWPPFLTAGAPVALRGVKASLVGTTKRSDGRLQVTFAGRPLYFFAKDTQAGDVGGAGIAHWAAVAPSGAKVRAKSTGTTPSPSPPVYGAPPGDGGYGP